MGGFDQLLFVAAFWEKPRAFFFSIELLFFVIEVLFFDQRLFAAAL